MARNRKGPSTYSDILDVAARVFDTKGYHEATVQDIADAANLTKGGLYHHLSSKEATLFAINERYLLVGLDEIQAIAGDESKPIETRLHDLVVAIAAQHDTYDPDLRVSLRQFDSVGTEYREKLIALRDRYEAIIESLLRDAVREGIVVDMDVHVMSKYFFGALNWMCMWYRPGGAYTARQIGEMFAELILSSLLARREQPVATST